MYKKLVIVSLFLLVCFVNSAPVDQIKRGQGVKILRYDNEPTDNGYKFGYELDDGQRRDEEGYLSNISENVQVLKVYGSYSYLGDDGKTYTVEYIADENGFRPVGKHLPSSFRI